MITLRILDGELGGATLGDFVVAVWLLHKSCACAGQCGEENAALVAFRREGVLHLAFDSPRRKKVYRCDGAVPEEDPDSLAIRNVAERLLDTFTRGGVPVRFCRADVGSADPETIVSRVEAAIAAWERSP